MGNKKCVVRMRGGLGNQLFQFAYAFLISRKFGCSSIEMDVREYDRYFRDYELDKFILTDNCHSSVNKQPYDSSRKSFHLFSFLYRAFHRGKPYAKISKHQMKKGFVFTGYYCDMPSNLPDKDVYLYGYFQNADLLLDYRDTLSNLFSLKAPSKQAEKYKSLLKDNSVSINIRVLDELEKNQHVRLSTVEKDKYIERIDFLVKRRGNIQLVVSSNNIKYIKEQKWLDKYDDVLYIEDCDSTDQLEILKNCRDFIVSNSTFSWWVGFLGSHKKDSIVLLPRIWMKNTDISDTKFMFPGAEIID